MNIFNIVQKAYIIQQGQALFDKGEYQLALEKYKEIDFIDPTDIYLPLRIAFCLAELGNYGEAQYKFLEAISLNADNLSLKCFLAINYLDQSMIDEAFKTLTPLILDKKTNKLVSDTYGLCLLQMGKIEEGYKALTMYTTHIGFSGISSRVLSICESYLSANVNVSIELDENIASEISRNLDEKVRTIINVLTFKIKSLFMGDVRKNAYNFLNLAKQSIDQKDNSKAKQFIEELLKIKPDNDLLVFAAEILLKARDYSGVINVADSVSDYKKPRELYTLEMLSLLRLDEIRSAESFLRGRERFESPYLYGLLCLKQGRLHEARKEFEKFLKSMNVDMGIDVVNIRIREVLRVNELLKNNHPL